LKGRVETGLSLNIDTEVESLETFRAESICPAYGHRQRRLPASEVDEKVLGKIKQIRLKHPELPVCIDGGVLS